MLGNQIIPLPSRKVAHHVTVKRDLTQSNTLNMNMEVNMHMETVSGLMLQLLVPFTATITNPFLKYTLDQGC